MTTLRREFRGDSANFDKAQPNVESCDGMTLHQWNIQQELYPDLKPRTMACEFTVLKDASVFAKLKISKRETTNVLVRMDEGFMTLTNSNTGAIEAVVIDDIFVQEVGKKEVEIVLQNSRELLHQFRFEHILGMSEFCGTIQYVQHMAYLKHSKIYPLTLNLPKNDKVLQTQLKGTLKYAKTMWKNAQWKELWPYCGILESLAQIHELLQRGQLNDLLDAQILIQKITKQFREYATLNFMYEINDVRYYYGSYIMLLICKMLGLSQHIELHLNIHLHRH